MLGIALELPWLHVFILCTLSNTLCFVSATHFRGAHFWWSPDPSGTQNRILLEYRIAWRRDYSEKTVCDSATISSGELIGPEDAGYIFCDSNCDFRVGNLNFRCTDFSITEGWSSGLSSHLVTFQQQSVYQLSWRGRSWLDEVVRGQNADWEFLIKVDTRRRSDTGAMNSSPKSAIGTILRIQQGCNQTTFIPVSDADNDRVICRWARDKECGGICGPPTGFILQSNSCQLQYLPVAATGLYALAIQIEDFQSSDVNRVNPLSSVPLQFIVQIYSNSEAVGGGSSGTVSTCDQQPVFIIPTPEDSQCFTIQTGQQYTVTLIARTKDQFTTIVEINTVSSIGMTKSPVMRIENSATDYFVDVTWNPTNQQLGDSIFCFVAVDSVGISSDQRCIYISTYEIAPQATSVTYRPEQNALVVGFDQQIQVPSESRSIEIYQASNNERILKVDTSSEDVTSYTNTSLIIVLPQETPLGGMYYLLLQEGAAQGYLRCGAPSRAVINSSQLTVTVSVTTLPPSPPTPRPPTQAPSTENTTNDYLWLIILVAVVTVLFILIIIIAIIIRWKMNRDKSGEYLRQERQEEYLRSIQNQTKIVGYDGPYAPNFHDIEVKFR